MAIHCAAIQGRTDGIRELIECDKNNTLREALNAQTTDSVIQGDAYKIMSN